MHGTRIMSWGEVRQVYGRELVNLRSEGRYVFLNTLFSVSEGVMYMQVSLLHMDLCMLICSHWSGCYRWTHVLNSGSICVEGSTGHQRVHV